MPPRYVSTTRSLSEPAPPDEIQLLRAIRRDDPLAFAHLVTITRDPLLDYARTFALSRDESEDVVHGVYAALWFRRSKWRLRGRLLPYLRRAIRNRALDVRHSAIRRTQAVVDLPTPAPPDASDQRVLSFELEVATLDLLGKLPRRCRQAFLLCAVCEYSHTVAAQMLGLKASTINYYLVLARKALLAGLRDGQFDLPAWLSTPDMIFSRTSSAPNTPRRCRPSAVDIAATVDTTRHDPSRPFAMAATRITRRRTSPDNI